MRTILGIWAFVTIFLISSAAPLAAQPAAARVANPDTVEFQVPRDEQVIASAYRIELFLSGLDTSIAVPVKIIDLHAVPRENDEPIRIDLRNALEGIADGEYVATIRTVRADGTSPRSQPTTPFIISGYAVARPAILTPIPSATAPTPNLTDDEKRRERFWTKVAIAVGAGAVLLPFVIGR